MDILNWNWIGIGILEEEFRKTDWFIWTDPAPRPASSHYTHEQPFFSVVAVKSAPCLAINLSESFAQCFTKHSMIGQTVCRMNVWQAFTNLDSCMVCFSSRFKRLVCQHLPRSPKLKQLPGLKFQK